MSTPLPTVAQGPGAATAGAAASAAGATGAGAAVGPKSPEKKGGSIFRRKPWGRKGTKGAEIPSPKEKGGTSPLAKTKRGRGKRPGFTHGSATDRGSSETPDGGIDVGNGWIMYTTAEGFQYCWNETLQESRSGRCFGLLRRTRVTKSGVMYLAPVARPKSYPFALYKANRSTTAVFLLQ